MPDTPRRAFTMSGNFPRLPSPYWGSEMIWNSQTSVHNPMLDQDGRVWMTSRIRKQETPAFCRKGSDHPSAKLFPMEEAGRQVAVYDPKTKKLTHIDTCFTTHHLIFAEDKNNTLWLSGGGARQPVIGWIDTKKFLETGDAAASQGWTAYVLDTNGNGKRDDYVEPNQPVDPTKDKRILAGMYGIGVRSQRWLDLGLGAGDAGRRVAHHSGRQSARDDARRILRGALQRSAHAL